MVPDARCRRRDIVILLLSLVGAVALFIVIFVAFSFKPVEAQVQKDNPGPDIKILQDGVEIKLSNPPFLKSGRVFVPLRDLAQLLDFKTDWDDTHKVITVIGINHVVTVDPYSIQALVDGKSVTMNVPPVIRGSSTYVPLQFFASAFSTPVTWDTYTKTVNINNQSKYLHAVHPNGTMFWVSKQNGTLYMSAGGAKLVTVGQIHLNTIEIDKGNMRVESLDSRGYDIEIAVSMKDMTDAVYNVRVLGGKIARETITSPSD
ncbi:copper amine oxidase N-terminal domain-containing protein [Paenibacillus apiarius]|uniref:copper amine oxidase N-terminal domain-containing protein n=1 Tax=Paenibacillus apiarius TaxID=46240 RepID=UPI00197D7EB6|nr:copper amine oxidase N-terminal domain-containing protein [Paenibacillus apiarius]MBN3524184.1 copper amine oxidase N-terminal domain-containing protein [Paenibacillus apiarius]